jgi:membrane-associated protein
MLPEFLSNEWIVIYGGLTLTLIIVFIETAFPIGVLIPGGELLLIITGLLGGTRWIAVDILFLLIPITLVAFMADLTSYALGMKQGQKVFEKKEQVFYKKKYITQTLKFNEKFGNFSFLIARFFPVIRTFNPLINGARETNYPKFFILSGIGALIYVNAFILLGYFLGRTFPQLINYIEIIIAVVLTFIIVTPIIIFIRRL